MDDYYFLFLFLFLFCDTILDHIKNKNKNKNKNNHDMDKRLLSTRVIFINFTKIIFVRVRNSRASKIVFSILEKKFFVERKKNFLKHEKNFCKKILTQKFCTQNFLWLHKNRARDFRT